ncbi:hypothetical protein [Nocardia transvalensis]|uniref:hypothetical protein n=1 Tax=Nocardia transvalensis TaxID=37333 RepID=UPI001894D053|nr:hypothetical protein [Nocardia transvalensis]MBF6328378.1 hypothetical protein [Nocardia transvalensis]
MTIEATDWRMTSDLTPEHAFRVAYAGTAVWRLSWLPEQALTRAQAWAGMELDELLSDPARVHDEAARLLVVSRAAMLGIGYEDAVVRLARRMLDRLRGDDGEPEDPPCDDDPVLSGPIRRITDL